MAKAKRVRGMSFVLANKVGQLSAVCELINAHKANITSISARKNGNSADFFVTSDRVEKVKKALSGLGVEIREAEALRVDMPNKPGRLLKIARRLAEAGVDINAAWSASGVGKNGSLMLMTSNDVKAEEVVNKKNGKEANKKK